MMRGGDLRRAAVIMQRTRVRASVRSVLVAWRAVAIQLLEIRGRKSATSAAAEAEVEVRVGERLRVSILFYFFCRSKSATKKDKSLCYSHFNSTFTADGSGYGCPSGRQTRATGRSG